MVHVIATIHLNEGTRDRFLSEFHRLVPEVLAEEGCIEYGPAIDIESGISAQGPLRPCAVTVIEKWASLDALKKHLDAPHMHTYRGRVKDFVSQVELQILENA
ncbi:MAG: putative quinol monooxygenase [Planctomycetaceae bacterium]